MQSSAAGRVLRELLLASVLAPLGAIHAQTIGVNMGDSARITVAPSAKVTVPVRIDLSNATGGLNIASLQANVAWGSSRLTFDSIRVVSASGFSLTSNTTNASTGSLSFNGFSATALGASGALANLYFTASATTGGTRVTVTPTAAGNELGASIMAQLRMRALDVCVAPSGKWGDANNDGLVNIIDAQQIARASVGLSTANPTAVADRGDVTADGNVNILDAQQIARFSVGLSAAARVGTDRFVAPAVSSVLMTPSAAQSVAIGATLSLSAEARDAANANLSGCAPITWSSSAPSVAGVDANGLVTGFANGTATITASSGGQSASVTVTVGSGSVTTGLRVTVSSPIGSPRYYAIVDSGGLTAPIVTNHDLGNARSGSFDVAVPVGSGYRVRVVAVDSLATGTLPNNPQLGAGLRLSGVNVVSGALTAVSVSLQAMTIAYTHPVAIAAGENLTASISLVDPAELIAPATGLAGIVWFGPSPWTTDGAAPRGTFITTGAGTATTRSYSGNVYAPTVPGTYYSQAEVSLSVGGVLFRVMGPRLYRGESLRTSTVGAATSGIRVTVNSPVPVQRFVVIADSGAFITRATAIGTSMTSAVVTVPAVPRGAYRVRIAAVDSSGMAGSTLLATVRASGVANGVSVTQGTFTDIAVNLKVASVTPTWPSAVTVGQGIPVAGVAVDTGSVLTSCTVRYKDSPLTSNSDGLGAGCSLGAVNTSGGRTYGGGSVPGTNAAGTRYVRTLLFANQILPDLRTVSLEMAQDSAVPVTEITTGLRANISFPSGSSRAYVVVDSGGLGAPVVRRVTVLGGARSTSVLLPVPAGSGYRMRVWLVDSSSTNPDNLPLVVSGARARGLSVTAGAITDVPISAQPYSLSIMGDQTRPAGTVTPWTVTMFDPSRSILPGNCQPLYLRGSTATFTDFSSLYLATNCSAMGVTDSSYVNTGNFAAALDPAVSYHQFYHQIGTFSVDGINAQLRYYAPSSQRGELLRTLTTTAVTTGIQLAITSSMPASRYLVMVTGGGLPSGAQIATQIIGTGLRSGSIFIPAAPASNYTVRVAAIDSMVPSNAVHQVIAGTGKVEAVNVGSGAPVSASVAVAPVLATITGPTTVSVGDAVSMSVVVADPGGVIINSPYCAPLHYQINGVAPTGDQTGSQTSCAIKTFNGAELATYSSLTLPTATAGTVHHQFVLAVPFEVAPSTVWSYLISPSRTLGQPWRTLTVNPITTGIRLSLTSPRATGRFFIRVDSGGLATTIVRRVVTSSPTATVDINVPAGSGYRVRVIAADAVSVSPDGSPLVAGLGVSSGITVAEGTLSSVSMTLREPEVSYTMPTTVSSTQQAVASVAVKYPIRAFRSANNVYCTVTWSTTSFLDLVGAPNYWDVYGAATSDSTATCAPQIPAQGAAMTLFHRLRLDLDGFSVDGFNISPRIFVPSSQRGEGIRTLTVNAVSTGVTVNFTSPTPARRIYAIAMGGALALRQAPDSAAVAALRRAVQNDQLAPASEGGGVAVIGQGEVVVALNGNGLRTGSLTVPLPPGTNYDIRLVSIDSASWRNDSTNTWGWVLGGSGRLTGVTVPGTGLASINIALAPPGITVNLPDSAFVGSAIPGSVSINDPADLYEGLSTGWAYGWAQFTPWTRNSAINTSWSRSTSTLVSAGVRRWDFAIPAQATTGTLLSQTSVEAVFLTSDGRYVYLDAYDHNLAVNPSLRQTRIVAVSTGIRADVSFPTAASRAFVVVDSGGLAQPVTKRVVVVPGTRTASITVPLPIGSGYRVRVFLADSLSINPDFAPLITQAAHTRGVSVTAGGLTVLPMTGRAATASITAPTTRAAGTPTPFSVTVFDPSKSAATSTCRLYQISSTAAFADLTGSITQVCALLTQPDSTFSVSANYPAALEAGVIHYRLFYWYGDFSVDGNTVSMRLYTPSSQRGEAARTLTTTAVTTGMTVNITSPMAASRYLVSVTGGALLAGTHVAASISGTNMRSGSVTIPLAPASGYAVRVVAIDSAATSNPPVIRATGSSSATVGTGSPVVVGVAVGATSLNATLPTAVARLEDAPANLVLTDPGAAVALGGFCIQLNVQVNGTPPTSPFQGNYVNCLNPTALGGAQYSYGPYTLPTATAGTIYLNFFGAARFDLPTGIVYAYIFAPDRTAGAPNISMTVNPSILGGEGFSTQSARGTARTGSSSGTGSNALRRPPLPSEWVGRPTGDVATSSVSSTPLPRE